MAEQRLIDANALIAQLEDIVSDYTSNGMFSNGYDIKAAIDSLEDAPTIDPETLPIVRQLRAELARMTAERDAAEKDRAELADYELAVCEQFCFGDREHNIAPCAWLIDGMCKLRKWRGLQRRPAHE